MTDEQFVRAAATVGGNDTVINKTAVFTIVSKNYFHYGRVLMRSLQDVSPEWDRYVLLADTPDDAVRALVDAFELIEASVLPIPDFQKFAFRYSILEFNTAVKPWFFRHLFARGYTRVVYLDPDIFVYSPMRETEQALADGALAVLVPHLTGRLLDTAHPSEHAILQSGTYNLGFLALGAHASLDPLLDFWCEKSIRHFVAEPAQGLFTDQRWMDLVPGMFPDVTILRHAGYDVAYWNLPHRELKRQGAAWEVNGDPLVFFHFSGIDPVQPGGFSKHQNRYSLSTVGGAAELTREYCAALHANGLQACRSLPYAYGTLNDGTPVPDILRKLYRQQPEVEEWAGEDPFSRSHAEWGEPLDAIRPPLTRVMLALYQSRSDLRLTWPDVMGADREAFARWFAESPEAEQMVAACFIAPIRQALMRDRFSARDRGGFVSETKKARFDTRLIMQAVRKAVIALQERRLPLSPQRWRQLYRLHVAEHVQHEISRSLPALGPIAWPARNRTRTSEPYEGFHAQSAEESTRGVAWLSRSGSVDTSTAVPASSVSIFGHHMPASHKRARGNGSVQLTVTLDDVPIARRLLDREGDFELSFTVPAERRYPARLGLRTDNVFTPAVAGQSADARELSVQIARVIVNNHALLDFARETKFQPLQNETTLSGLTIVGYATDDTGVAAGAHASVSICETAAIPCELIDARTEGVGRGKYPVILLHVNADETPRVAASFGQSFFEQRYAIGLWAWELEDLPEAFLGAFEWIDEVWTPSRFIQAAVSEKSPVPVVHMPHAVTVNPTAGISREDFGLPETPFLFLAMYDVLSIQERKNPLAVIHAFRQAFPNRSDVGLVVRVNHASSRPDEVAVVRRAVAETPGAVLLDRPMSRQKAQALQVSCDAFVSLHRSEGFGLNIAEAMLLEKPVVVTAWSGNLDFTTPSNACMVDYQLVPLTEDHGPYRKGSRWADPNVDQASEFMIRLVDDQEFRRQKANAGRLTIATEFSPQAVGQRYRRRLTRVSQFASRSPAGAAPVAAGHRR
jgi:glycosyltransferase involved in cell wall biosynthesis